ncbi:hypothetical protein [Kibdelosporangium philippinense]|uniref:hypothetical protein n=1 Tax=Kibdelosporangium philippinense TaxID=211113 RepID=UPI0036230743
MAFEADALPEEPSYAHTAVTRLDLTLAHLQQGDFDGAREALSPVLELPPSRRLAGVVLLVPKDHIRSSTVAATAKLPASSASARVVGVGRKDASPRVIAMTRTSSSCSGRPANQAGSVSRTKRVSPLPFDLVCLDCGANHRSSTDRSQHFLPKHRAWCARRRMVPARTCSSSSLPRSP